MIRDLLQMPQSATDVSRSENSTSKPPPTRADVRDFGAEKDRDFAKLMGPVGDPRAEVETTDQQVETFESDGIALVIDSDEAFTEMPSEIDDRLPPEIVAWEALPKARDSDAVSRADDRTQLSEIRTGLAQIDAKQPIESENSAPTGVHDALFPNKTDEGPNFTLHPDLAGAAMQVGAPLGSRAVSGPHNHGELLSFGTLAPGQSAPDKSDAFSRIQFDVAYDKSRPIDRKNRSLVQYVRSDLPAAGANFGLNQLAAPTQLAVNQAHLMQVSAIKEGSLGQSSTEFTGEPLVLLRPSGVEGSANGSNAAAPPAQQAQSVGLAGRQAIEIWQATRQSPIEVAMTPEELGHLRFSISNSGQGLVVNIMAERHDTLDMVRRHLDELAREFRQTGQENVAFSFSHGSAGRDGKNTEHAQDLAHVNAPMGQQEPDADHIPRAVAGYLTDGMDIRV